MHKQFISFIAPQVKQQMFTPAYYGNTTKLFNLKQRSI